jgi:hypothetical protein
VDGLIWGDGRSFDFKGPTPNPYPHSKGGGISNFCFGFIPLDFVKDVLQCCLLTVPFCHAFVEESFAGIGQLLKDMDWESSVKDIIAYNKHPGTKRKIRLRIMGDYSFLEKMCKSKTTMKSPDARIDDPTSPVYWVYQINHSAGGFRAQPASHAPAAA